MKVRGDVSDEGGFFIAGTRYISASTSGVMIGIMLCCCCRRLEVANREGEGVS